VLQIVGDFAGVTPAVLVVVLENIGRLFACEPFVQIDGPLAFAGALRIRRSDQSECGGIVGIFFTLANEHWNVRRRGNQFGQPIRDFWPFRLPEDPGGVPVVLRELLG
jgi:hypothetical protein